MPHKYKHRPCCRLPQEFLACMEALFARYKVCHALQCVAVCCSVLQCVAVCCSVLQCAAMMFGGSDRTPQGSDPLFPAPLSTKRAWIRTSVSHTHIYCARVFVCLCVCMFVFVCACACVCGAAIGCSEYPSIRAPNYGAVCCSVLQCVAACCTLLLRILLLCLVIASCKVYYMLPCVAMGCSVLKCGAMCCSVSGGTVRSGKHKQCEHVSKMCHVLPCVAVCCSVQCVAVCCSVL